MSTHYSDSQYGVNELTSRKLTKALGTLVALIVRPIALFVATGAAVSLVRYCLSVWREVPGLLYEMCVAHSGIAESV